MNPHPLFCLNVDCPSRGVQNGGNIRVHHSLEERFRYTTCGQTFATQGNLLRAWGRLVSFGSGDAPEGALAATDAAPVRVKKVKDGYRITRWLLVADYSHNPQTVSQERV